MQYHKGSEPIIEGGLTEEEQRQLADRVANSQVFKQSPTLRAFFVYVAEHTLAGLLDEVKEQKIGSKVLGRKPDYDTANDNIVRIRARQVRQKLDDYFASEGRDSHWIISIPKGGYAPVFQPRPVEAPPTEEKPGAIRPAAEELAQLPDAVLLHETRLAHESVNAQPSRPRFPGWLPWLIASVATLGLLVLAWRNLHPLAEASVPEHHVLWSQFFPTRGKEVTVVVADSGFAVWQNLTGSKQDLAGYVEHSFLREPEGNEAAKRITYTPYTSLADVILTSKISQLAAQFAGRVNVKHARHTDIHDFSSGNVILLGSAQSDPWVELFEPNMSFVLGRDPKSGDEYFQNRAPKAGEPAAFYATTIVGGRASEETYAVAAFMPNLAGTGHVLILEGIDMEGTEAAGEFVLNPAHFASLLRAAGVTRDAPLKPFEALIKLRAISGGYEALELAGFRYLQRY